MKGGQLLIVTMLGLLALSEGGHLFKKGLVAGAFKSLFKGEKKEQQHCEIKWEDVWKPHCTTTYEKICKQEPQQECSTEWREECWTEHEEICEWLQDCHEPQEHHYSPQPQEHHYSSPPSSHGSHESVQPTVQASSQTKRSADHHHEPDDEDSLDDIDEKTLSEALENIPASELLKLSQELESNSETGVATRGDESSRKKRSIHL